MHRLVIVSGPNRGSAFTLIEGENSIGRQMDNQIVLSSSKVSKRHCALMVSSDEVMLRDDGSTNGTFVNGALARQQPLRSGDKLGVGEFVLELVKAQVPAQLQGALGGDFMMTSTISAGVKPASPERVSLSSSSFKNLDEMIEEPKDPIEKLKILFEGKLMPNFYGMMMRSEFRSVAGTVLLVAGIIAIAGSGMPMQDLAEQSIRNEAKIRAKVLCREVADRYSMNIVNHTESQIDFSFLESEESIKSVVITNPTLQIIAPPSRTNQIYSGGIEANYALAIAKRFREGVETGQGVVFNDENLAVWVEPIKVNDPKSVRSKIAAIVVLAVDFSGNMISAGGTGVAYGTGVVVGGIALLLAYLILMRMAAKPYEVLNEELDQVLRGELARVTREFQWEETQALWDNINAAAQRLPKGMVTQSDDGEVVWDQQFEGFKAIADQGRFGMVGFDPNLSFVAINELFTEQSGIRSDALGQALNVVADQALLALILDLMKVASASPMKMTTDRFVFQGDDYEVVAIAISLKGQTGLAVFFKRKG